MLLNTIFKVKFVADTRIKISHYLGSEIGENKNIQSFKLGKCIIEINYTEMDNVAKIKHINME